MRHPRFRFPTMCDYSGYMTSDGRATLRERLTMEGLEKLSIKTTGVGLSDIRHYNSKQTPLELLHTMIWGCIPEDAVITDIYEGGLVYPYENSDDTATCYSSRLSMRINCVEVSIHCADHKQNVGSVGEKVCLTAWDFLDELCDQCGAIAPRFK